MRSRLRDALDLHNYNPVMFNNRSNRVPDFVFKEISVDFVRKEVSALRVKKSSGLKNIPSRLLKLGATTMASPLACIYNMSLKTRQTPKYLKSATVALPHKSGSLVDVNNHRLFSVLPVLIKIFERPCPSATS